jgi:hypothetical protein
VLGTAILLMVSGPRLPGEREKDNEWRKWVKGDLGGKKWGIGSKAVEMRQPNLEIFRKTVTGNQLRANRR